MRYFRTMETVQIRDAIPADLKILLQFEQEIIKAERPYDPTLAPDPINYYDIGAYIVDDGVKVLVAEVEGHIVASGYALKKKALHYLDHEWYGYLGFMYTLPEYRGRGINQQITQKLVAWCRKNGLTEIRLTVYEENQSAVKAYEKSGFTKHLTEMRFG